MAKHRLIVLGTLAALAAAFTIACTSGSSSESKPRTVQVTAFELKGSTTADKLAPPTTDFKKMSDGYEFKGPGVLEPAPSTKWEVSSYMWSPGEVTAFKGDTLELNFFVVNGNKHTVWIEGPDGSTVLEETLMQRGREYKKSVKLAKAGVYRLICNEHDPTMTAEIVALASR